MPSLPQSLFQPARAALLGLSLALALPPTGSALANDAALERARAAAARGDLRAAILEYRNAMRLSPDLPGPRVGLAQASLDIGDGETAEAAARAAIERGYDRAAGTALLLRAYLVRGRMEELLRDFPLREADDPPAVVAQVAAARALAQVALNRLDDAASSVALATRLAPDAVEPQIAAATLAMARNDRAAAQAAVDRILAIDPDNAEGLMRRAMLQFAQPDAQAGLATLDRLVSRWPTNLTARLRRAEALLQMNEPAKAKQDVDALLAIVPNSAPGTYLRALLQVRAEDWKAADESLQRLGGQITNFPDGLLLQAVTKRALGQSAQALDAAQRYVGRRPDDPRGVRLLAALELDGGRPAEAAAVLARYATRGRPMGADLLDLQGRALVMSGRPREAAEVLAKAAEAAPRDAGILARLALARFAIGDAAGTQAAAAAALAINPNQPGTRELLATAALARGEVGTATAELEKLDAAARRTEVAMSLDAALRFARLDTDGARAGYEALLRSYPDSIVGRLGLARVAVVQGKPEENERLLGEVLQRDPDNNEALSRLANMAISGDARAPKAREILERVQTANPTNLPLALTLASVLIRGNDAPKAVALLQSEQLRARAQNGQLSLLLSEAQAGAGNLDGAEAAARAALAEEPNSIMARRQLAAVLLRKGDAAQAESLVRDGLRTEPGSPVLQQFLVAQAQQTRGLDAALATADDLARLPGALPAAAPLRGDLLLAANRPEEAARAFAAAYAQNPSLQLAMRQVQAYSRLNRPADSAAALNAWLQREPTDVAALSAMAQLDIAAGRLAEAERRLLTVVERTPQDPVALNNLAWLLGERGDPRARGLAERAHLLLPSGATTDTLGWILARTGDARQGVVLLRQAATAAGTTTATGRTVSYHLAYALNAAGDRAEAQKVLEPLLADKAEFPERAAAEKLLAELRAGR